MAELVPAEREIREVQRRLVARLDALLARPGKGERLGKRQRATAIRHLLALVENILEARPDPAHETTYDRYRDTSLAQRRQEEVGYAEEILGKFLGDEALRGHQARNVDELFAHAQAKAQEQEAEREAKRRRRSVKPNAGVAARRKIGAGRCAQVGGAIRSGPPRPVSTTLMSLSAKPL